MMGNVTPMPNAHTLELEPGALDEVPLVKLVTLLAQYGVEIASVDGRLVIRRVAEGGGPEAAA